ncbi:MAG: TraB family protein [Candidatus Nanohaloarchaea archaeon]
MKETAELGDREVTLVGTSHVSEESVEEVEDTIEDVKPDLVGVELDRDRYDALREDSAWEDLDVAEAISEGKGFLLALRLLISIYQRKVGSSEPGTEMLRAVEVGESQGSEIALVDRDINETFRRARELLSFSEKVRLVLPTLSFSDRLEPEDLTDYEVVDRVVEELGERFPGLRTAFLDERNAHMASEMLEREFETAVMVVGAAHFEGVKSRLENPEEFEIQSPDTFPWFKAVKYGLPAFILLGIGYSFYRLGFSAGVKASAAWILINGILALAGAIAARSHPLTWLVSFISAPLTSLDPALGAGMVASYSEAKIRPPSVDDLEQVSDMDRYRELWRNQAGRVILTFVMVSIGSAAATFISAGYIASLIG